MRTATVIAILILAALTSSSRAVPPVHVWSFGGNGEGYDTVFDAAGNVFVLSGTFVPDSVVTGDGDMTIGKYDANGASLSSRVVTGNMRPRTIDVDAAGNIVVATLANGPIDFGNGPLNGGKRLVIARWDTLGNLWTHTFEEPHAFVDVMDGQAAFDTGGNVIVSATFEGTVDFGGGPLTTHYEDIAVVKYDAAGGFLWNRHVIGRDTQWCRGVAVDQDDNIVITGRVEVEADFGGGMLDVNVDVLDVFLAKYAPDGAHVWSKLFGEVSFQEANAIAVDPSGSIAIVGDFGGTLDFGGGPIHGSTDDMFIAKFDEAGEHIWSRGIPVMTGDWHDIALDHDGNTIVTGMFFNSGDFGGGPVSDHGNGDFFLVEYGPAGQHQWGKTWWIENEYAGAIRAIGADAGGHVVITGSSPGIDFGGGPVGNLFVAKFATEDLTPVFITSFTAKPAGAHVSLAWQLWSDEAIEAITIYRSDAQSPMIGIATPGIDARSYVDSEVEAGKSYTYQLLTRTRDGDVMRSQLQTVTLPGLTESVGQNHPNPFNPKTTIEFTLSSRTRAMVNIYDISGQLVAMLDSGVLDAGRHRTEWDGRDRDGHAVASGVYFYQLVATRRSETRKMILLK